MKKLYFVRHAESEGNVSEMLLHDPALTDLGKEQARRLAKYFKETKINKVYCSDLERAKSTAAEMMKILKCNIEYTSLIRERSAGIFYGKNKIALKETYKKGGHKSSVTFRPKGGENYLDVQERAKKFIEILKEDKSENIAVVTHEEFIRCFILYLFSLPFEEDIHLNVKNTSIHSFFFDDKMNLKEFHLNDSAHLIRESPHFKVRNLS